jgi:Flp pilus assembly protein TadG
MATRQPPRMGDQRGQSLVVITLFMMSLLGMAAMAIDVGSWYQTKRSLQADADSAALAGVASLPAGWSYAQTAAQTYYAKNGLGSDSVTYANPTVNSSGDSVRVTATRTLPGFFAKLFGHSTVTITATSQATLYSFSKVVSTGQLMPWGVMRTTWTPGQSYPIYTDNSSANNGALDLKVKSGSTCNNTYGSNDYRNSISGGNIVCDVSVGDVIDTNPGNNAGPTRQGIDGRITSWDPINAIVSFGANGQVTVLKPNSPQLIMVPIVENTNGSTTWPNGSGQVRVVGFAYFVLVSPGYTNNGKTVNGTFVGIQNNDTTWSTGSWNGANNSAYTARLTS